MNKSELADAVANTANLSKADGARAVDAVIDSITATLCRGDTVSLVGFGTFQVKQRNARQGRNPRTGEEVTIEARRVVTFRPSGKLREVVDKQSDTDIAAQ